MASGYRALLQSLDETEKDVKRGLGRSVQIKKPTRCCRCCRSNAAMWTCIAALVLTGLVISVGLPILLTVPVESSWHWKHWMPHFWNEVATNSSSSIGQGQHVIAVSYITCCCSDECVTHCPFFCLKLDSFFLADGKRT